MDSLLTSVATVTLAEVGDKTQLLALFLAARFTLKYQIIFGILAATLINHALSSWFGLSLSDWIPEERIDHIIAISFILVGLWLLVPDKDKNETNTKTRSNAFVATFLLFSIAEIGDKTQVATLLLGAHYQSVFMVTIGTTIGMLLANIPVILAGQRIMKLIPAQTVRMVACVLFIGIGTFIGWRGGLI